MQWRGQYMLSTADLGPNPADWEYVWGWEGLRGVRTRGGRGNAGELGNVEPNRLDYLISISMA